MIKRPFLCLILAGSLGLAFFGAGQPERQLAHAQAAKKAAPPRPSKAEPPERVKIFSDKVVYKRQKSEAVVTGRVKILQDNTTIYADELLYKEDTKESFVEDGVKRLLPPKKCTPFTRPNAFSLPVPYAWIVLLPRTMSPPLTLQKTKM